MRCARLLWQLPPPLRWCASWLAVSMYHNIPKLSTLKLDVQMWGCPPHAYCASKWRIFITMGFKMTIWIKILHRVVKTGFNRTRSDLRFGSVLVSGVVLTSNGIFEFELCVIPYTWNTLNWITIKGCHKHAVKKQSLEASFIFFLKITYFYALTNLFCQMIRDQ